MVERLQKILAQWGIASRRQAEQMIVDGRVRLNGSLAELGQKADPAIDAIEVDNQPIRLSQRPTSVYFLLHKPAGFVSTCQDPQGRPTVLDLLPPQYREGQGVHPVGRLDAESTGALLLTNDGDLTYGLTHPRHHVAKTYRVWVKGQPSESALRSWRRGLILDGRKTQPAQVKVLVQEVEQTCLEIVLWEGRNRQIRRTATQLGHPVLQLHRVAIGPIQLQTLDVGHYRNLSSAEVKALQAAGLETAV